MATAPKLTPAWKVLHREAGKALLRSETEMLADLRGAVRHAARDVAQHLGGRQLSKAVAARTVRASKVELERALEGKLVEGRGRARQAGRDHLDRQIRLLRKDLTRGGYGERTLPGLTQAGEAASDALLAARSAGSLSEAWSAHVLAALASRKAKPPSAARLSKTAKLVDARTRRIATTENAQAFSDEKEQGLRSLARDNRGAGWLKEIFKLWNCSLERVCARCLDHEGEQVPVSASFARGDEPGLMHPNCRCYVTLSFTAA